MIVKSYRRPVVQHDDVYMYGGVAVKLPLTLGRILHGGGGGGGGGSFNIPFLLSRYSERKIGSSFKIYIR